MVVAAVFIWSFFPIINIFIYQQISPIFTLILGNLFACLFFLTLMIVRKKFYELKNKKGLVNIATATFFLSIMWMFVFSGIKHTTAGNASIILLMEIFFSFLYFGIWHKEKFSLSHITGVIIMAIGAIIILFPGEIKLNLGDLLVLVGAFFAPLANYFQQKSRKEISAETLLFVRYLISFPFILIVTFFLKEQAPSLIAITNVLPLLLINGIAMFGISKLLWIESIHRISVTKAASFGPFAPAFTLIFAYFLLNEIPTFWQLSGFIPILIGAILITKK